MREYTDSIDSVTFDALDATELSDLNLEQLGFKRGSLICSVKDPREVLLALLRRAQRCGVRVATKYEPKVDKDTGTRLYGDPSSSNRWK